MKKVTESLNITNWWRKGWYKYLVAVAMYFFVWSPIQKLKLLFTLVDTIMNIEDRINSLHFHLQRFEQIVIP